ncbi:hypothetical protein Y032_0380g338 [Ancylostoma ceylanicum]|uniref:Uncharacterized protein n=1 Tax=Ancylostoma ceylanicum TaxID=53326 RepID=A0A016RUB8_9BILA|nr:hypothetical protein Y032_0380g338 [Ancylostoma ceylanicum]
MKYMLEDLLQQGFKPDRFHSDLPASPLALPLSGLWCTTVPSTYSELQTGVDKRWDRDTAFLFRDTEALHAAARKAPVSLLKNATPRSCTLPACDCS